MKLKINIPFVVTKPKSTLDDWKKALDQRDSSSTQTTAKTQDESGLPNEGFLAFDVDFYDEVLGG